MELIHNTGAVEKIRRHPFKEAHKIECYKTIVSPVGPVTMIASNSALLCLKWGTMENDGKNNLSAHGVIEENTVLVETEIQLNEYFSGKRKLFDIPLAPEGTEFQKRVWQELLKIPYGEYITYGEQARRLDRPSAARAVGAANGRNPIGIIIPCHRVLGANGSLTGFAGGLIIKQQLLALEGIEV